MMLQYILLLHENKLLIGKQSKPFNCIHTKTKASLFSKFFKCYEKYKKLEIKNPDNYGAFNDGDRTDLVLFIQTTNHLKMSADEMMIEVEKLYKSTMENNPEHLI
jgi:hypothetical protein